jgi:hypothetical protein
MELPVDAKLRWVLMLLSHTLLAIVGLVTAGLVLNLFVRPIAGKSYGELVHSYPILVFSLLVIFLFGYLAFREWHHKPAFFAWVLPSLVALHLLLTRGQPKIEEFRGALPIFEDSFWDGTLTWLASGIAYSIGAVLANRVATHKPLVLPPHSERAGK